MKFFRDLLDAEEPLFTKSIEQLEHITGKPSADIKLKTEIIAKVRAKTKALGLDPDDSTGEELYYALLNKAKDHDALLAKMVGGEDPEDIVDLTPRYVEFARELDTPKDCWVIKDSVAKKMLAKKVPTNSLKTMGVETLEQAYEKASLEEVYASLRFAESGDWLNEFNELYKDLKPEDFETRQMRFVAANHDVWADIAAKFIKKKRHNITHLKELGVIMVLPMTDDRMRGPSLKIIPLIIHYINEIRLYSAFFKLIQMKPTFGEDIVDTLIADPGDAAIMAGQNVHWRVIQRYFGKLKDEYHPESFQPHVHPEDLHWRKAEEVLYQTNAEFKFWEDLDYVAQIDEDGRPNTFNLMDVSLAYSNDIPYKDRYIYHFRESLWNELFARYMGQDVLEKQILQQLDNDLIAPEKLGKKKPKKSE